MYIIIGIDPSKSQSGLARIVFGNAGTVLDIATVALKDIVPGTFSGVMAHYADWCRLRYPKAHVLVVVEDRPIGGPSGVISASAMSEVRGMIFEACIAVGIPVYRMDVSEWRKIVLGNPPEMMTKAGKTVRRWTKKKKYDNVTPAVENFLENIQGIDTSKMTIDEMEAVCIAFAGMQLINRGEITFEEKK